MQPPSSHRERKYGRPGIGIEVRYKDPGGLRQIRASGGQTQSPEFPLLNAFQFVDIYFDSVSRKSVRGVATVNID
jgi:hypothetical protein